MLGMANHHAALERQYKIEQFLLLAATRACSRLFLYYFSSQPVKPSLSWEGTSAAGDPFEIIQHWGAAWAQVLPKYKSIRPQRGHTMLVGIQPLLVTGHIGT